MEREQKQDQQEDYGIEEGAVGGEEENTSIKLVTSCDESKLADEPSSGSIDVMNNLFSHDIDLSRNVENRNHERMCNKTYSLEKSFQSMLPLGFNIPVQEEGSKKPNNQGELSMAEFQDSFQSLDSEGKELPAIATCNVENNNNAPSSDIGAVVTSISNIRRDFPLPLIEGCMVNNLSVTSCLTSTNDQVNSTTPTSRSSNCSSRNSIHARSPITDETMVTDCPDEFVNLISQHLNGKGCNNWRNLLGLYNWNYNELNLFERRHHPGGYFCSILGETEFQEYTIKQLKIDLNEIPKRNTLRDVETWIRRYNDSL